MKLVRLTLFLISLVVPFGQTIAKDDDDHGRKSHAMAAVTLPIAGTAIDAAGQRGVFSGTLTINRFVGSNRELMAVGIVRGTLTNAQGQVLKSGLQDVVLPVTNIGERTVSLAIPLSQPQLLRASLTEGTSGRFILTQAQSCGILHLDIGGNTLNLLGFMVTLSPVTLDVSGDAAGPLGALVCEIVNLLGTAANVVGLLNTLLGTLTGLLGGLGL
jgi:hypothetical protein